MTNIDHCVDAFAASPMIDRTALLFAIAPRTDKLVAYSTRRGARDGAGKGRPGRDDDFETRVMAFLVLSCVRTLTLLAHIRAWS